MVSLPDYHGRDWRTKRDTTLSARWAGDAAAKDSDRTRAAVALLDHAFRGLDPPEGDDPAGPAVDGTAGVDGFSRFPNRRRPTLPGWRRCGARPPAIIGRAEGFAPAGHLPPF